MAECKVYLCVDEDGSYEAGTTAEEACERFEENIGGTAGRRVFELVLDVPLPKMVSLSGSIPETGGAVALTVNE